MAFNLFSTYGLPVDTVREYVNVRKGSFDDAGFQVEFRKLQELSRNLQAGEAPKTVATLGLDDVAATKFLGYDELTATGKLIAVLRGDARVEAAAMGDEVTIISDRTSFYAESGGQVGDTGTLATPDGTLAVEDTVKLGAGVFAHKGKVISGTIRPDTTGTFTVDGGRRAKIRANHTATHLMHAALRKILGPEVGQAGSRVDPDRAAVRLHLRQQGHRRAARRGRGLGERRDPRELSLGRQGDEFRRGGRRGRARLLRREIRRRRPHPSASAITRWSSAAAPMPRRRARSGFSSSPRRRASRAASAASRPSTGAAALERVHHRNEILQKLSKLVNAQPEELETRIQALAAQQKAKVAAAPIAATGGLAGSAKALPDGVKAIIAVPDIEPKTVRETAVDLAKTIDGIAIIMTRAGPKVKIAVAVSGTHSGSHPATELLAKILPKVGGSGGGGKATLAEGMGTWSDTIPSVAGDLSLIG